jgi:regulator of protease activity HflC (stomatin/prohibitin superfamily)
MLGVLIFFIAILGIIISGFRVIYQFEKGVVFTFGKYSGQKSPGLVWIIPFGIQVLQKLDMRIKTIDVPRQEIITKDNISIMANAVVYFRIVSAEDAIMKIQNLNYAVTQFVQAALRDALGNHELDFILSERVKLGDTLGSIVAQTASNWGVDIDNIKIQEIEIPQELKRAMAAQAEAERERRSMLITSDAELQASKNLSEAAQMLAKNPVAIQLRTLQTIRDISTNPSQKIVLFMPNDFSGVIKNLVNDK